MAGKTTKPCTEEQYKAIIELLYSGTPSRYKNESRLEPNSRIAAALIVEANTGLRIGDVLSLRRSSFVRTKTGYRFDIVEEKTGKERIFPIQAPLYKFLMEYIKAENIEGDNLIFPLTVRAVQKHLQKVSSYLGFEGIGTHSFRKMFASNVYHNNGCDIELARRILQHSSAAVTARYIGVTSEQISKALDNVVNIPQ